jgi:cell division protein FtsI/penicillin-binding protein 2
VGGYFIWTKQATQTTGKNNSVLTKNQVGEFIGDSASFYKFPTEMTVPVEPGKNVHAVLQYSFDAKLQSQMEDLFRSYGPDYGAFVALDAKTGRVLSLVSFTRDDTMKDNLALRATFPSASVFKVVTAAAAIENQKLSPSSLMTYDGRNHTLYKNNVLHAKNNRWTRTISLREAFAQSINTVFGKLGAFTVGATELREYASRFGFNRKIAADFNIQEGKALIPSDPRDAWGIAQSSSGYTRDNTMSPLQGAMIAAAIVNDGELMEPYLVQSVYTQDGNPLYTAEAKEFVAHVIDPQTAGEMRDLMRETVKHGTSRGAFKGFSKSRAFHELDVGGKTGSLTGLDPAGKYDWFVGFANDGERKIAIAALTVNKKAWRVKSSFLARRAIETYFKPVPPRNVASVTK